MDQEMNKLKDDKMKDAPSPDPSKINQPNPKPEGSNKQNSSSLHPK
jgi:hypothetical protein